MGTAGPQGARNLARWLDKDCPDKGQILDMVIAERLEKDSPWFESADTCRCRGELNPVAALSSLPFVFVLINYLIRRKHLFFSVKTPPVSIKFCIA